MLGCVFQQEKMKSKNKLVPRLLGITKESVMRVDERTKDVVQEWPLTTVKRWAASPKSFTLVWKSACPTSAAVWLLLPLNSYLDCLYSCVWVVWIVLYCNTLLRKFVLLCSTSPHKTSLEGYLHFVILVVRVNWQIFSEAHLAMCLNWVHCCTLAKVSRSWKMSLKQWSLWAEGQITGSKWRSWCCGLQMAFFKGMKIGTRACIVSKLALTVSHYTVQSIGLCEDILGFYYLIKQKN